MQYNNINQNFARIQESSLKYFDSEVKSIWEYCDEAGKNLEL